MLQKLFLSFASINRRADWKMWENSKYISAGPAAVKNILTDEKRIYATWQIGFKILLQPTRGKLAETCYKKKLNRNLLKTAKTHKVQEIFLNFYFSETWKFSLKVFWFVAVLTRHLFYENVFKAAFIYIYEHLADWFEILPLQRWFEGFCLSSSFYEIFNELNCSQNNPVFLQFVIQDWRRLVL